MIEPPRLAETPPNLNLTERSRLEPMLRKILGDASTPRERAVAIHRFVRDSIEFGVLPEAEFARVSQTLALRKGYSNTKGAVFTAMLGMASIPARQHFVDIPKTILRGVIPCWLYEILPLYITASYAEVFLDGAMLRVDSYAVDGPLAEVARRRLCEEGTTEGYGIDVRGTIDWDGASDSLIQCVDPSVIPPGGDHGSFTDATEFYLRRKTLPRLGRWKRWLLHWAGAELVNRRVREVRRDAVPLTGVNSQATEHMNGGFGGADGNDPRDPAL